MRATRPILSLLAPFACSLALSGAALADGACVYVKNETFQCKNRVASEAACKQQAPGGLGEFHVATTCKGIGHGVTWGLATPPPPPAKGNFDVVPTSGKPLPAIPSPLEGGKRKLSL
jgi:hypothetical protein